MNEDIARNFLQALDNILRFTMPEAEGEINTMTFMMHIRGWSVYEEEIIE